MAASTMLNLPPTLITTSPRSPSPTSLTLQDNSGSQRHSIASTSGTSFFTARMSPLTPSTPGSFDTPISRPSSTQTVLAGDSESATPRQMFGKQMSETQELHLVKISGDTPSSDSNPVPANSVSHAVNRTAVMHVVSSDVGVHTHPHAFSPLVNAVGPPPPSPPASIKHGDESDVSLPDAMHVPSRPLKSEPASRPVIFEEPVSIERARSPPSTSRDGTASVDSRETQRVFPRSPPSAFPKPSPSSHHHDLFNRSSTDSRLSTLSARRGTSSARISRAVARSDGTSEVLVVTEASDSGSTSPPSARYLRGHSSSLSQTESPDGYLQPPASGSGPPRPTRRNTTGGHIRPVQSAPQAGYGYDVSTDIEDDIQLQAEQIRRERKRAKAQKDAEEAMTRTSSRRTRSIGKEDENRVLVGNLIGEDHVNYVLMYNMLTGIRIAVSATLVCMNTTHRPFRQVSRCQAKIKRPLTDDDFTARHKYSFDMYAFTCCVICVIRLHSRQYRK